MPLQDPVYLLRGSHSSMSSCFFWPVLELQGNSCVQLFHWPHEVTHAVLTSPLLCILGQWESLTLLTTLLLIGIGCFQL